MVQHHMIEPKLPMHQRPQSDVPAQALDRHHVGRACPEGIGDMHVLDVHRDGIAPRDCEALDRDRMTEALAGELFGIGPQIGSDQHDRRYKRRRGNDAEQTQTHEKRSPNRRAGMENHG